MSTPSTPSPSSMTGYALIEHSFGGKTYRIEVKTLNNRFLDLKLRLPRELNPIEHLLRALVQSQLSRGSVDFKIETLSSDAASQSHDVQLDLALAEKYYQRVQQIRRQLDLHDTLSSLDIAQFPDVLKRAGEQTPSEPQVLWASFEPAVKQALDQLKAMRAHEGSRLAQILESGVQEIREKIPLLRERRTQCQADYQKKVSEKIQTIFQAHPISEPTVQSVLESRIAQELAILLDKTDIEEELARLETHVEHFSKTLASGGSIGRKLEFMLQELGREVNTLGNKAQDFSMQEEALFLKVKLEQLREQVLNLE